MCSYSDRSLKAFDCICYDLLIAKSNAYGFDKKAFKLIYDYLNSRSQKIKVGSSFSSELGISGVPQGSILDPSLFNIDIRHLFFFVDITTLQTMLTTPHNLISHLELTKEKIFSWFILI